MGEAVAALHRVAQVFVCFATDRSLGVIQAEKDKAKKMKGKNVNLLAKPTLGADHVMRFLSADLPQVASKMSSLFPDLMPTEFKPPGVILLEHLEEQRTREAAAMPAGSADSGVDGQPVSVLAADEPMRLSVDEH